MKAMREGKKMSESEIRATSERLYRGVGVVEREGGTTPRRRAKEEGAAACTFTPKISAASRKLAQKFKEKQQLQQQRSQADGKKPHKKQLADAGSPTTAATLTTRERAELAEIDAHCTFTPTISRKSREIHASLVRRASSATRCRPGGQWYPHGKGRHKREGRNPCGSRASSGAGERKSGLGRRRVE